MARRVPGRPAVIGTVTPGKITVPRSGRTGKDLRSAMMGPFSGFLFRETPRGGLSVSCAKANRFPPDRGFGSSLLNCRKRRKSGKGFEDFARNGGQKAIMRGRGALPAIGEPSKQVGHEDAGPDWHEDPTLHYDGLVSYSMDALIGRRPCVGRLHGR